MYKVNNIYNFYIWLRSMFETSHSNIETIKAQHWVKWPALMPWWNLKRCLERKLRVSGEASGGLRLKPYWFWVEQFAYNLVQLFYISTIELTLLFLIAICWYSKNVGVETVCSTYYHRISVEKSKKKKEYSTLEDLLRNLIYTETVIFCAQYTPTVKLWFIWN